MRGLTGLAVAAMALILGSCGNDKAQQPQALIAAASEHPCEKTSFEDVPLTLCVADPKSDRIFTVLGPEQGAPYRSLGAYAASRRTDPQPVRFVMNAGMFDDDGQPIGYYVENGEKLKDLNRAKGPGNFHMLPNGVFFGAGNKWQVRASEDFYAAVDKRPDFGTQSGPMLVIDGALHPDIDPNGESLRIRNAVGVDAAGRALFVISDKPISFGKLARYYRDVLKVKNALFLDGTVSALWDPASGRLDEGFPIGPLIVVEKQAKAPVKQSSAAIPKQ